MTVKSASTGLFHLPAAPAALTAVTQSASANTLGSAIAMGTTGAAIFIVGVTIGVASVQKPTYVMVQILAAASIVGEVLVPYGVTTGATGAVLTGFVPIWPPIPVATSVALTCKTASDVASAVAWGVSLQCINQANVVDGGIREQVDVEQWNGTNVAVPATAGLPDVNAKNIGGTAQTGRDIGASVLLSTGAGTGQLDFTSGVVKVNLVQILGTVLTETAGQIAAGFKKLFDVASPVFTLVSVNQTGDAYARIGAPAGASASADIAAVKVDTAAVKLQTDKLAFTGTNKVDASVRDWVGDTIPARSITGVPKVDVQDWTGTAVATPNTAGVPVVDTRKVIRQGTAQATGDSTTAIKLDASASATDNAYRGMLIQIISGTGSPEYAMCTAYVGSTKIATVAPAWPTAPDGTSIFQVQAEGIADVEAWGSVAPNALQSGRVDAYLGAVASGVIVAASFASGALDAVWSTAARTLTAFGFSVTVGTNSDKTGYALTSGYDPAKTAAQAGDAMALTAGERTTLAAVIWNALTSGLSTASSIGKLLVDNVNATIGSRSSHSASDVWAVATRLLTAGTNIVLAKGTGVTGLNDLDAAGVRGAVGLASANLDTQVGELATDTDSIITTLGTPAGVSIAADLAEIEAETDGIAAIPTGDTSGVTTLLTRIPGTVQPQTGDAFARLGTPAGASIAADLAEIEAETDGIGSDTAGVTTLLTRVPGTVQPQTGDSYARLGAPAGVSIAADIAEVEAETDGIATLNNLSQADVRTAVGLASANLDTQLAEIEGETDGIAAVKAQTDKLGFDGANNVYADLRQWNGENVPGTSTLGVPKVDVQNWSGEAVPATNELGVPQVDVRDWHGEAVPATSVSGTPKVDVADWGGSPPHSLIAGRVDVSLGAVASGAIAAASFAAGALDAAWSTATSGLTTVGSIGKRLADNVDAAISSRLATSGYTAPDNADVVAIKAKTDNLPASPAAVSDVPTATQNADALLDRADAIETGWSPRHALRIVLTALGGKLSGAGTGTETMRNVTDTKDRIVATDDANGNRSGVTLDPS